MQIDAQDIENMLVTSIICDYVVERKKLQKDVCPLLSKHFPNQNLHFGRTRQLFEPKSVYSIPTLMPLTSSLILGVNPGRAIYFLVVRKKLSSC
jgi:hypothetical protein